MTDNLYCLSMSNAAGNMLGGFSAGGTGAWSHYQIGLTEDTPTPGLVQIAGLATSNAPAVAATQNSSSGSFYMAVRGFSDDSLYFATSAEGTAWTAQKLAGMRSDNPPFLTVMPYAPTLMLAFTGVGNNDINVATSDDNGVSWTLRQIGQTSSATPSILYTSGDIWEAPVQTPIFYFLMAFRANDSSNNILICNSYDGVAWQYQGQTGQQARSAPALAYGQPSSDGPTYLMAFLANDGSDEILVCRSLGGLSWSGAARTGLHATGNPQLINLDNAFLLLFRGRDDNTIYRCRSVDGINWNAAELEAVCPGVAGPGVAQFSFRPPPLLTQPQTATAKPPPNGLQSAYNYLFAAADKAPLRGVKVVIVIDTPMAVPPSGTSGGGLSFQVNCYSTLNHICVWQQYDIHAVQDGTGGTNVFFRINTWPPHGFIPDHPSGALLLATSGNTALSGTSLAKGTRFAVALDCDILDNVTGVTFTARDATGKLLAEWAKTLTSLTDWSGAQVGIEELAPVAAFEVNLVADRGQTTLTGGSATVTCSAWNLMDALPAPPAWAAAPTTKTGEVANSSYGTVPDSPSTVFSQSITVAG